MQTNSINFETKAHQESCLQDDCVGDKDTGAKSWSSSSSGGPAGQNEEGGGWTSYLLPMFLAAVAAYVYRVVQLNFN